MVKIKECWKKYVSYIMVFLMLLTLFGSDMEQISASNDYKLKVYASSTNRNQYSYAQFGNAGCMCTAYAIAYSIIEKKDINSTTFSYDGGPTAYDKYGKFESAYSAYNAKDVYNCLNSKRPVLVHLGESKGINHWVVVIGYKGGIDSNNPSNSSFIAIDPASGTEKILTDCYGNTPDHMKRCISGTGENEIGSSPISASSGGGSNNPIGCLDVVEASNGTVHVRGWAYDQDSLGTALKIHVYVGGPAGSGAPGYEIVADKSRPDVNNAFPGVGNNHGFDDTFAVSVTGNQKVYVYAINVGGGTQNPCIGSKSVNIPKAKDTTIPTISDVYVHDVTASGYKVHCVVHDDGGNLSYVLFPTWTPDNNDQDDITWDRADVAGAGWELDYDVKISSHNNESNCNYRTHIYVYDTEGNVSSFAVDDVYIGTKNNTDTTQKDKENTNVAVSKPSLDTLAVSKKGFTAYWSKSSNADGYQLQYCTNSLFVGAKKVTINDGSCTYKKVSKLSAKKKYYVRVRAFKNVNGKKKYSSWSKVMSVKTK